jgi:hypothetical protein
MNLKLAVLGVGCAHTVKNIYTKKLKLLTCFESELHKCIFTGILHTEVRWSITVI